MDVQPERALTPARRPLTERERRLLRARIRAVEKDRRRASRAYVPVAGATVVLLWAWTILASDASWVVITFFWALVGGAIAYWAYREMRTFGGHLDGMAQRLASAAKRGEADVFDIHAKAFAVLEEIEDEGACYAFELPTGDLAFIEGQEFYESARFPSLDFSLIYLLDEQGDAVDMVIDGRGVRAGPDRIIPASVKRTLDVPGHLTVMRGSLEELERGLSAPRTHRESGQGG